MSKAEETISEVNNKDNDDKEVSPMVESKEETMLVATKVEFKEENDYNVEDDRHVMIAEDLYTEHQYEDEDLEIPLEDQPQIMRFQVTKIAVRNLRNVEIRSDGKNDPFVKMSIGSWHHQSTTMEGAGGNATWRFAKNNPSMSIGLSNQQLFEEDVDIQVYDQNLTSKNVLIGIGKHSLEKLLTLKDEDVVDMVIPLTDADGYESGEAIVTFISCNSNSSSSFHQEENQHEVAVPLKRTSLPEVVIEKQESNRISLVKSDDDFKDYLDALSDDDGSYEEDFG